jgi:hypothetical protein
LESDSSTLTVNRSMTLFGGSPSFSDGSSTVAPGQGIYSCGGLRRARSGGGFQCANPIIYATTAETSLNRLSALSDTLDSSTATTLATAGANTLLRGLDSTPIAVL